MPAQQFCSEAIARASATLLVLIALFFLNAILRATDSTTTSLPHDPSVHSFEGATPLPLSSLRLSEGDPHLSPASSQSAISGRPVLHPPPLGLRTLHAGSVVRLETHGAVRHSNRAQPGASEPPSFQSAPMAATGRQFVFSYGSLINVRSRGKTAKTGSAHAMRVSGLRRFWGFSQPSRQMTALAVSWDEKSSVNGVILTLTSSALPAFDRRERGYTRHLVPHHRITALSNPRSGSSVLLLAPSDQVWVYIVDQPSEPTAPLPICQSYLDICTEGFLHFGEDFTREFIKTTSLWRSENGIVHWLNDRSQPRLYEKGFVADSVVQRIDSLLQEHIPHELAERYAVDQQPDTDHRTTDPSFSPPPALLSVAAAVRAAVPPSEVSAVDPSSLAVPIVA